MAEDLSVIIVNYNVRHFLEQALLSVRQATKQLSAEIFVVDNNSVDGSVAMVESQFPEVKLIANKQNLGFSQANNQAIRQSTGRYVLLLNPDTVVEEDTFKKCLEYADARPKLGALGVKMVDGKGNFLPESKRGLPTPWNSFCKMSGLGKLFKTSKRFNGYYQGHLPNHTDNPVPILSGAYMWIRREALDQAGLLDEDFFMYGEDIDLSYRITQAGFANYYYPQARIIHYKGESTRRTSVNYVLVFYKAMIVFVTKHFSSRGARIVRFFLNLAIYLRAAASLLSQVMRRASLVMADAAVAFVGIYFLKIFWETHSTRGPIPYTDFFLGVVVPVQIFIWLLTVYFSGGYDKPFKIARLLRGAVVGTLMVSAVSNFVDPIRFSKALIVLGGSWVFVGLTLNRLVVHFVKHRNFRLEHKPSPNILVAGGPTESERVMGLLRSMNLPGHVLGFANASPSSTPTPPHSEQLGELAQLNELVQIYKIDEIVFCARDIPAQQIIEWMVHISGPHVPHYRIVPDSSNFIIGSHSSSTQGDFYTMDVTLPLAQPNALRSKRVADIGLALVLLVSFPVLFWYYQKPGGLLANIGRVLRSKLSWVGPADTEYINLKGVKKGVVTPSSHVPKAALPEPGAVRRLDLIYAKNYSIYLDYNIVWRNLKNLGQ